MSASHRRRTHDEITSLARDGLDWVSFATQVTESIRRAVAFDRSCWHTVDPGTVLFTGSLNQGVGCSGRWLATHEYVLEDVNKWWFLARSGRRAGATSLATHGDLSRSARHRSHEAFGIGDELRGSFVSNSVYWGAAGFLRDRSEPWFTEDDVTFLASLSELIGEGLRRSIAVVQPATAGFADDRPGVVVLDADGNVESMSPAAERLIKEMVQVPAPASAVESPIVQIVSARARTLGAEVDPLELAARARVQTRSGAWLLLYGTRLSGGPEGRTAVVIQPAASSEVAPIMAMAYGLTDRECEVTRLCMQGRSTKQIAETLAVSPYTVQDHLKSIFQKTGVRSRRELVGQVFLEHYVTKWEGVAGAPTGWTTYAPLPVQPASAPPFR